MGSLLSERAVLSIGSTHPWNSAGVGLDARVCAEYGVHHLAAIAGVTAQDEGGLRERFAVPVAMLRAQLACVRPQRLTAIRVGAIFDVENILEVARYLQNASGVAAVVDPVLDATLGGSFGTAESHAAFADAILCLPVILTPNIPEAQRFLERTIANEDEMIAAAQALRARGPRAVLLKGGHLAGDPVDVLVTEDRTMVLRDSRIDKTMRGTGCTLAAAFACEIALGYSLIEAVTRARKYVREKIQAQP